jgi:multiple sugar transport system substrate-binding protein
MLLKALLILLVCCITLPLSGCGDGAGGRTDGRVTITFWHSFVSSTIPALNELIARFEEEHPDIRVRAQYIPTGDALVQKLITAVQSNSAPDISWLRANYMQDMVAADAIYPMSHFIDGPDGLTQEDLDDIYPALIQYASWQGTMYSMPMEATNLGLLYNKDHFREVGLDPERPPQTWDELRETSRRLLVDRNNDGRFERIGFAVPISPATGPQGPYMVWQWIPFLWQAGGYLVDLEQTHVKFGEEPGVRALRFWKELYDMQNMRHFTQEYMPAFVSGQASMILDGPWNLPNYPRLLRNMDWGIAPLPSGPSKQATIVAGEYLGIFKQSANPDAAWTFVKWMTNPEVQAFWSMRSGYLPIRRSVFEVEEFRQFLEENPAHRAFAEQMSVAQAQRPIDFYSLEIERNMANAIEQATVGGADPESALRSAADASNRLLRSVAASR